MAANPTVVNALYESFSHTELVSSRRALVEASLSPERLTGEVLDGVSWAFAPTTYEDIVKALEAVEAAIKRHSPSNECVTSMNGRIMDLSRREIE